MKDIDHKTLLCDEDDLFLLISSPTSSNQGDQISRCFSPSSPDFKYCNVPANEEEQEELFMEYIRMEKDYNSPCREYFQQLEGSASLRAARSKAVRYMIDVCKRLGVATAIVFNAVNYVDRFFALNYRINWENWMVELLSVACASLACKFYEACIPSLYDLQIEDLEHSFKPITIQEMELLVLKALDWRLSCVTAFSFAYLMLGPGGSAPMTDKVTHLLVHSLLDPLMTKFRASIIAKAAVKCATKGKNIETPMLNKIHVNYEMDQMDNCTKILEGHLHTIETSGCGIKQCSPVSVIPTKGNSSSVM